MNSAVNKTTDEELKELKMPKPIKPWKSFYTDPPEASNIPRIPAEQFRRRMGVRYDKMKTKKIKFDSENAAPPLMK